MRYIQLIQRVALVLGLSFFVALGSAMQVLINVDDSAMSYVDPDVEEAYIDLAFDGQMLWLILSTEPLNIQLPSIEIVIPDLEREDFFGNTIGARLQDVEHISLQKCGCAYRSVEVKHATVDILKVRAQYMQRFTELGFSVQAETANTANVLAYQFTHGAAQVNMVLTRRGNFVFVYIHV